MGDCNIIEMERTLKKSIGIELSLNDLRIIVASFSAMAYWSEVDGEEYLDCDAWKLKERLEGLYRDELDECGTFGLRPENEPRLA